MKCTNIFHCKSFTQVRIFGLKMYHLATFDSLSFFRRKRRRAGVTVDDKIVTASRHMTSRGVAQSFSRRGTKKSLAMTAKLSERKY
jgi:hypothetical protein